MNKNGQRILTTILAAAFILTGCGSGAKKTDSKTSSKKTETVADTGEIPKASGSDTTILVGASPSPHAEILEAAKSELEAKGWKLKVKEYTDYIQPNVALQAGDLDANYFQHTPYLDSYNKENGTDLKVAGTIHYEPFGIFPGKTKSLDDLKDGATVGVPNDTTNEARALLLLEANGLIKLKDKNDIKSTVADITDNPKNLKIKELEAAQIPRSLQDLDIAVINGNYAIEAGLSYKNDSLALEDQDSLGAKTYGNVIAVRKGEEKTAKTIALLNALKSDKVKKFIEDKYDGAVVPLY
jgi:D-methionine transport system substrate-binding protein